MKRNEYFDFIKGLAIIGVISIHYIGPDTGTLLRYGIQQLIRPSVFIFVFLAGYFTNCAKIKEKGVGAFVLGRLRRLLVPYAVWTLAQVIIFRPMDFLSFTDLIAKDLCLGLGVGIGYYVIVLVQLTFLTPLLCRMASRHCVATLGLSALITGAASVGFYWLNLNFDKVWGLNLPVPVPFIFFVCWLFPYVLGLVVRQEDWALEKHRGLLGVMTIFMFLLKLGEAWIWRDCPKLAFGQISLTTLLFSTAVALFGMSMKGANSPIAFASFLGQSSFFIYLTHLPVCSVFKCCLRKFSASFAETDLEYIGGLFVILFAYYFLIRVLRRLCSRRFLTIIGV